MSTHLPDADRYISMAAAADLLDCSVDTIRRRISAGQLAAYRFGHRTLRVKLADVEALVQRVPTVGAEG